MSNTRTPKSRALGGALREAREQRGIGLRALAKELGRDPGMLSRWETGERTPKPTDVSQILTHLGVTGERYDAIVELAGGGLDSIWRPVRSYEHNAYVAAHLEFERTANSITSVCPLLVPGLLQVPAYVRAIMSAGGVPDDEVEMRIAVRLGRQTMITRRDPVRYEALIGEAALRQVIGSREIMVEQLQHLVGMAGLPNADLHVVPFTSGWHPALEVPFTFLQSNEAPPIVSVELRLSSMYLHEPPDVEKYRQAIETVRAVALSPKDSLSLIVAIAAEMESK